MPTYELFQVDAFTQRPLAGNPCAVVLDARGLDDVTMQAVAREMNLSETSFVFPSSQVDFAVRYFTPIVEIPMAGHPTIATTHALRESGRIAADTSRITLSMPAGLIPVDIDANPGRPPRYTMTQLQPVFGNTYDRAATAAALSLDERDLADGFPILTVSTGTPQLMVPLRSLDALARVRANRTALFPPDGSPISADYFSVHVFAQDGRAGRALCSRHFAPLGDIAEDPFTGSATGGMAAYCLRYGFVKITEFTVTQGEHVGRPGEAIVRVLGEPPGRITGVQVGGSAVTVMRGTLTI
jgi:trans-2,3-dihydro-3-hydroxyanthranilate isomerase